LRIPFGGEKSIEFKSISAKPPSINITKFSPFRFPNIRYATQAFPVIIEPVARRPDLKSGLENEKPIPASLGKT